MTKIDTDSVNTGGKNPAPKTQLSLADFLPYRLSVLSNRVSHAIAEQYEKQFQITVAEWRIMAVLGEEKGLSASEVAVRTAMDKVAVSRAVSKLLEAGRIVRKFSKEDKRRSVLTLSTTGTDIYNVVVPRVLAYEAKLLNALSQKEQALLNDLLVKLQDIQLHTE
ncbi:MAG: MarR family winged helix-turn-helix transcriptional regulator [Kordiimonadaceae bacterium]|nr:MarR family winged helix-turn-helix transcriptional regulator [Kordiimonadaceae bacterium]